MQNFVVPHDRAWRSRFESEAAHIAKVFGDNAVAIHHIGSTSIPGILAKPVIDILVEAASLETVDRQTSGMTKLGYEAMGAFGIEGRRFFRKDDANGVRTHHVHVFEAGAANAVRHLAFRDFLRAHPDRAKAYSDLKAELVARPGMTREAYMDGKDPFIEETEAEAVVWYQEHN